jgi:hypothetical protein
MGPDVRGLDSNLADELSVDLLRFLAWLFRFSMDTESTASTGSPGLPLALRSSQCLPNPATGDGGKVMAKRPTPRGLPPGRGTVIKHDRPPCWRRKDAYLVPKRERLARMSIGWSRGAASEVGATMALVATLADRILDAIRYAPLDDDVLARRLGVGHRQAVNQAARRLEAQGRLRRFTGPDGKIVNALPQSPAQQPSEPRPPSVVLGGSDHSRITEDEVKEAVRARLTARCRGCVGPHPSDHRCPAPRLPPLPHQAKAEAGRNGPQQVNYFVGMFGELVQRMDDVQASYGIALPDNRQYRGLVNRLPALAKEWLRLAVFWVSRERDALIVEVES